VSVLEKSSLIVDIVAESPDAATLTAIAHRLGLPRSSIHRLLSPSALACCRCRHQHLCARTRLALKQAAGQGGHIVRIAEPVMVRCATRRRERTCMSANGMRASRRCRRGSMAAPFHGGRQAAASSARRAALLAFASKQIQEQELRRIAGHPLTPRAPTADGLKSQPSEIVHD
jgi:DNA-binding IclR family transcriptional regulator